MIDVNTIKEHAQVIGADGVRFGVVDHVDGNRIKLTRQVSVDDKHHYIATSLVAEEDGVVRLSANADVAVSFEEDAD